jgi:hypothetical protein
MDDSELRLVTQEMAGWGFSVFFPHQPDRPGFRVLAVAMRPRPTYAHYDPERMRVALRRGRVHPEVTNVRFDTSLPRQIGFGPGMVVLGDRVEKRVSFYTFGGTLESVRDALPRSGTLYALSSPAPILPLKGGGKVEPEEQLASSSEALMARMRAYQRCHGFDPDAQLAQLEPCNLYSGCIESLYQRYRRSRALMATFPDFYKLLQRERAWLLEDSAGRLTALERQLDHISGRSGLTGD